jgi:hypothetical protein
MMQLLPGEQHWGARWINDIRVVSECAAISRTIGAIRFDGVLMIVQSREVRMFGCIETPASLVSTCESGPDEGAVDKREQYNANRGDT